MTGVIIMLRKENKRKILEVFFDFPTKQFHLRQLSRMTGIAITSVRNYIDELLKEDLIMKITEGIYPSFKANRDEELFRFDKKLNMAERINSSGLISYLDDVCMPDSIILFGSASRGEDLEESDVDLFVQSKEYKIDLKKFEKKLNRKISVFFEKDFAKLNKELKNNILNGIKLFGYLKVF